MASARALLSRHRYALLALAASLAAHAVLIVGVPDELAPAPDLEDASYSAELVPLPPAVAPTGQVVTPPAPRPHRPRSPRRPAEAIASLPPIVTGAASAADAVPPLADALPPLAPPEPETAPPPEASPPVVLATAQPSVPVAALEPPAFPVEALPSEVSIRYTLTSAFAEGQARYSWSRDGDRYSISGEAFATGFFALFLEGHIVQESTGKVTAAGLRPERFVERKPNGPDEGLEFDWDHRTVEFHRNAEVKRGELAENTVDWLSMIFQLAHSPPTGESVALKVYTQRRLYEFQLKVLGTEMLDLPLGPVKALHLRHTTNDPMETVDVWLGVEQHYLPVKMRYPVARNRFFVDQVATAIRER